MQEKKYDFHKLYILLLTANKKYFFTARTTSYAQRLVNLGFAVSCYAYLGLQTWKYFSLKINFSPFSIDSEIGNWMHIVNVMFGYCESLYMKKGFKSIDTEWNNVQSATFISAFSEKQFDKWLDRVVPGTVVLGAVSLGYEILIALCRYEFT